MRKLALGALLGLTLVLGGCGPQWTVVKQAEPSPMTSSSKFVAHKVTLEGLRVGEKSEADWMSDKDADAKKNWEGDKVAMGQEFVSGFESSLDGAHLVSTIAPAQAGAFGVRAKFDSYEPGFYAAVASAPARIEATIDIVDAGGNVLDQFKVSAAATGMSGGQRARSCANQIGAIAAKYVKKRIGI